MYIVLPIILLIALLLIGLIMHYSPAPQEDDPLSWIDELEIVDAIDEDD